MSSYLVKSDRLTAKKFISSKDIFRPSNVLGVELGKFSPNVPCLVVASSRPVGSKAITVMFASIGVRRYEVVRGGKIKRNYVGLLKGAELFDDIEDSRKLLFEKLLIGAKLNFNLEILQFVLNKKRTKYFRKGTLFGNCSCTATYVASSLGGYLVYLEFADEVGAKYRLTVIVGINRIKETGGRQEVVGVDGYPTGQCVRPEFMSKLQLLLCRGGMSKEDFVSRGLDAYQYLLHLNKEVGRPRPYFF